MSDENRVRIGNAIIDLASVASVRWERDKLFVQMVGGGFLQFRGREAKRLWFKLANGVAELPLAPVDQGLAEVGKLEADQAA